jgi:hypothetical protein
VPQRRLLEALAKRLGFELVLMGSLSERRSLEVRHKPWKEALKAAIAPAGWAFVYRPASGQSHLVKVFVFPAVTSTSPSPHDASETSEPVPPQPEMLSTALVQLLQADDDETQRTILFDLISMWGFDRDEVQELLDAAQGEKGWVRQLALEALAEIDSSRALPWLLQALEDDNADVRRTANQVLTRLGYDTSTLQ